MFVNTTSEKEFIYALKYFDALKIEFFDFLFENILPDDNAFSYPNNQKYLFEVLSNSPSFKIWNKGSNNHVYENNGTSIEFSFVENVVSNLKIKINNRIFERKFL